MIKIIKMKEKKNVAMVAHDNRKTDLLEWVRYNKGSLAKHNLFATGTTGHLIERETGIPVTCFKSGPLGGDLQIGSHIAEKKIDVLFFFWDPLTAQPHDPDVKALLRIAVLWNIPIACNRASSDFIISSHLMNEDYERQVIDYEAHRETSIHYFPQGVTDV